MAAAAPVLERTVPPPLRSDSAYLGARGYVSVSLKFTQYPFFRSRSAMRLHRWNDACCKAMATSLFIENGVCHFPFAKDPDYFLDISIPRFSCLGQKFHFCVRKQSRT
jgi:hypothetical protein